MSDDRREEAFFAGTGLVVDRPALDGDLVLRDERPRTRWLPAAGSAILALLAVVNLRALVKHVTASPGT